MADKTHISWAEATWNPFVGCSKVSPGCKNCYAERMMNGRFGLDKDDGNKYFLGFDHQRVWEKDIDQPKHWLKPRVVFVNSMSDTFHPAFRDDEIDRIFSVMRDTPRHLFLVLTKRSARMKSYMDRWNPPLPNVWCGVSVESEDYSDRIYHLVSTRCAGRFVSAEPLLGLIDLASVRPVENVDVNALSGVQIIRMSATHGTVQQGNHLDWVIAGGESGPGGRPCNPDWIRRIRDDCRAFNVPFHFKQWGTWAPSTIPFGEIDKVMFPERVFRFRGPDAPVMVKSTASANGNLLDGERHTAVPEWPR